MKDIIKKGAKRISKVETISRLVLMVFALALVYALPVWADYVDHGDGTVTDTVTQLTWQKADDGKARIWENALAYCEKLNLGGLTDWRLPNCRELESLVDYTRFDPAIAPVFNCPSASYWSSSTLSIINFDFAVGVYFGNGFVDSCIKDQTIYVRCVREGPGFFGPLVSSFLIAGGAASTSSRSVTLNNTATDNPTYYMASQSPTFQGAIWEPYSAAPSFTLSAGDGLKTVYFKVKNAAGESKVVSGTITLAQLPIITSFNINRGAASTITQTVTLNNTATISPTLFMASEAPNFTGAAWQTYSAAPRFTLSAGSGTKTVYFKVENGAGESNVVSAFIAYTAKPTLSFFKINNDDMSTASRTVTLNNTATDSPTQFMARESSSFLNAVWQSYTSAPSFTLSAANGTKTVYFKVKNAAGVSQVLNDTIVLAQLPTVSSFKINGGVASTINPIVTLNNTATISPTQFMASEDPNFNGASWLPYSTVPKFTLSAGSGTKTVYFKVENGAGESTVASSNILLIVKPTVVSCQINNGDPSTQSRTVTLSCTATENPTKYMASESPTFLGAVWKPYSAAASFTLSAAKGAKTVYFKVKNVVGASNVMSATITLN